MSTPQNPETIIVKNKYYSRGLTEGDIWDYYQKQKFNIIRELRGRNVFFHIAVDVNKIIAKRKGKGEKYFRLSTTSYDEIMTGRSLAVYGTMNRAEEIAIIDVDVDDFKWAKTATADVYDFIEKGGIEIVKTARIRYTGKQGFHIVCNLNMKRNIDMARVIFRERLVNSELAKRYTIAQKRRPGIPNLDLSINKINGVFISLYSLSIWGLKCMEVDRRNILRFRQESAKIK